MRYLYFRKEKHPPLWSNLFEAVLNLRPLDTFMERELSSVLLFSVFLFSCCAVFAEDLTALVQDSLGRPVASASIQLINAQGNAVASGVSNAKGIATFSAVAPNLYAVQAQAQGFELGQSIVSVTQGATATSSITLISQQTLEMQINAQVIEGSKTGVSEKSGTSQYRLSASDVNNLPQGENTALNEVLLQTPGVANDQWGQVHIRGDHANIQYQINGVNLPQGIQGFGQNLDTRFAENIDLLRGALPSEYGLHTSGVVDITTKSLTSNSGSVSVFAGTHNTFNPSFEAGGSQDAWSYYVTGSYLTNSEGIGNTTSLVNPLHDTTHQEKGFLYLSYLLDSTTKFSLAAGTYAGSFQIPNTPGLTSGSVTNPYCGVNSSTGNCYSSTLGQPSINIPANVGYNSALINDRQVESNQYAVLSVQSSVSDETSFQTSLFTNYASTHYEPDVSGNLAFNGYASDVLKSSLTVGLQSDLTYKLNTAHTLKFGLITSSEDDTTNNVSSVYALSQADAAAGNPITTAPYSITDNNTKHGNFLVGVYAQDSWKLDPKFTLNYGLRYDYFKAFVSASQLSPRIGGVYKLDPNTTVFGGYAKYFTPPPNELVSTKTQSQFDGTTLAIPGTNSPVLAESDNYYDLGITRKITRNYTTGLDSYYKASKNTLDEGQFGPALILTPFNYSQGKIYGLEWTNAFKFTKFSGYANFALNKSEAKDIISSQYLFDPATLNYAANNWVNVDHEQTKTFSLGGSYDLQGTHLNASLLYASGLRNGFANTGTLPPYSVLNLSANRTFSSLMTGPVDYRFVINNALDRVYEIRDGSGIGVFAPNYGQRRSFYTGITKRF